MVPRIHTSPIPSVSIPDCSVWTHILGAGDKYDPDGEAYIDFATGRVVSRREFKDLTLQIAWALTEGDVILKAGGPKLQRGSTIGIYSPNSISFILAMYGGFAGGLKVSPANSSYTSRELAHQIHTSQAAVVVVHPLLVKNLLEAFKLLGVSEDEARKRMILGDWNEKLEQPSPAGFMSINDLIGKGTLAEEAKFAGRYANETALICFSSGTTGLAKGVETTHKNLVSIMCMFPSLFPQTTPGVDRFLGVLPGYHIYAAVKVCMFPLSVGLGAVILRGFDPISFGKSIEQYKITFCPIVPPILVQIANNPVFEQFDFSAVRVFTGGGAPLGKDLVQTVVKKLRQMGNTQVCVTQGYGLTETSPTSHFNPVEYYESKAGTIGILLPNLECRLVKDDGDDAQDGEPGEVWIRGPSIMKGYFNNPKATLECITPDGWFQTGDIGIRSIDGWYSIVDRKKELIKYKGFQVPPADLEDLLLTHSDIIDSGVIGVYDETQATELPRAYVVPRGGLSAFPTKEAQKAFAQSIARWVTTKAAKHKYLRGGVILVDAIPKSAAGKILRKDLRERAKKELLAEPLPTRSRL